MSRVRLAGVDHLSPSAASTLVDCERRYWWRYKHGLGRDERTEALAMGGGLAEAMEFGLEAGLAAYAARRPIADNWTDPVKYVRDGWIGEATITYAYEGYVARWPDPPGFIREQTYLCALPGTTRLLQVIADGVLPGSHMVEDKLRAGSSMQAQALENERFQGRQLTAEIFGHWASTGELLPVMFRNTKKIDPRKVKTLKTREQVIEVIGAHFDTEVFYEWEVTRTEEQLEVFRSELTDLAIDAHLILGSDEPAGRRNEKACHAYGRTCPAISVCQGAQSWESLAKGD